MFALAIPSARRPNPGFFRVTDGFRSHNTRILWLAAWFLLAGTARTAEPTPPVPNPAQAKAEPRATSAESTGAQAGPALVVAAAANVQFALEGLATDFTARTGLALQPLIGSSGRLAAQIRHGAPIDVFLSADTAYPDSLLAWDAAEGPLRIYAYGKLALASRRIPDSLLDGRRLPWQSIRRFAIADPKVAPYGRQALAALERAGQRAQAEGKLVFGESVAQVNRYLVLGTADAGLTALASLLRPETRTGSRAASPLDGLRWREVDSSWYEPLAQGAVLCRRGAQLRPREAQAFLEYLESPPAREILARYGYGLPVLPEPGPVPGESGRHVGGGNAPKTQVSPPPSAARQETP